MTTALIYIPAAAHLIRSLDVCLIHCAAHGYTLHGVVTDWQAVVGTWVSGMAGVAVVARHDHLDPDRIPRIEIAGQPRAVYLDRPGPHRRPHPI